MWEASTSNYSMGVDSFTFYFVFKKLRLFAGAILGLYCSRSLLTVVKINCRALVAPTPDSTKLP
jgi:hypothetical protein